MGFLSAIRGGDGGFDDYDTFEPDHLPDPGSFLDDHRVLTGRAHTAFHRLTRALFEERGVYDVTFGYNLARLNIDHRHPEAGFRYAVERDTASDGRDAPADESPAAGTVLRASFTPTTEFCPQSDTLTLGAFRAWNSLSDRHEYDVVRVRVDRMHDQSVAINGRLAQLESTYRETGVVPETAGDGFPPTDAVEPDQP